MSGKGSVLPRIELSESLYVNNRGGWGERIYIRQQRKGWAFMITFAAMQNHIVCWAPVSVVALLV